MTILVWHIPTKDNDFEECCERVYHKVKLLQASNELNCFELFLEDGTCKLINKDRYYIEVI